MEDIKEVIERLTMKAITSKVEAKDYPNCIVSKKDLITVLNRLEQLEKENKECKLDVQDYLKQAQENAEIYRKAQEKIQDLKTNSIPKSVIRDKIEEYLEFDKKHKRYTCNGRECFTFAYFKAEALKEILGDE